VIRDAPASEEGPRTPEQQPSAEPVGAQASQDTQT